MKKLSGIEAIRGFAAVYVFFHHLNPFRGTFIEPLFHFGQEAVILFFVISGFVIYLSATKEGQAPGMRTYVVSRAVRIYPIFIVSLGLAGIAGAVTHDAACVNTPSLVGNLLMLQDASALKPGVLFDTFCGDDPLWSLSYEVWFYVAFAIIFFRINGAWTLHRAIAIGLSLIGALTYVIHPNAISLYAGYFIVWWSGVELAREYRMTGRVSIRAQIPLILALGVCTLIWIFPVVKAIGAGDRIISGINPVLQVRHFVMALIVLGIAASNITLARICAPFIKPFAWIAEISYGLYISHQPVIRMVHALELPRYAEIVVCIFAALAVAYVLERVFQPIVVRVTRGSASMPHHAKTN